MARDTVLWGRWKPYIVEIKHPHGTGYTKQHVVWEGSQGYDDSAEARREGEEKLEELRGTPRYAGSLLKLGIWEKL